MKLACSTNAVECPDKDEILECFRLAPQAGYEYWAMTAPVLRKGATAQWADTGKMRRLATEAGLRECTEVYAAPFPTDSIAAAEQYAEQFTPIIQAMAGLDCSLLVLPGHSGRRDRGLESTIAGVRRLLELTEDSGIRIGLENHCGFQIESIEDYESIFTALPSPRLGIAFDVGHFHWSAVDWKRLIRQYPQRIFSVHIKDHIGKQFVPIGTGEIDLHGLVAELNRVDYNGALALEHMRGCTDIQAYISDAFLFLKTCLDSQKR